MGEKRGLEGSPFALATVHPPTPALAFPHVLATNHKIGCAPHVPASAAEFQNEWEPEKITIGATHLPADSLSIVPAFGMRWFVFCTHDWYTVSFAASFVLTITPASFFVLGRSLRLFVSTYFIFRESQRIAERFRVSSPVSSDAKFKTASSMALRLSLESEFPRTRRLSSLKASLDTSMKKSPSRAVLRCTPPAFGTAPADFFLLTRTRSYETAPTMSAWECAHRLRFEPFEVAAASAFAAAGAS